MKSLSRLRESKKGEALNYPYNVIYSGAMKTNIHQIFYNEETKKSRDTGFLPLDNTQNKRPDWREYWPIRNYLLHESLDEDALYGFFSPKFKAKTGLTSDECYRFINSQPPDIDVVSFSPFYDLGAFFQIASFSPSHNIPIHDS